MDEEKYTRNKSRSRKGLEQDATTTEETVKPHAGKLMNETSRSKAMRDKLRTGKADTAKGKNVDHKNDRIRKQGKEMIRKFTAASAAFGVQNNDPGDDNNTGSEVVNAGSHAASKGAQSIYGKKTKAGRSAGNNGYGNKLHGSKQTTSVAEHTAASKGETITAHQAQKNLMKKEIQMQAYKERAKEEANTFGNVLRRFVDKAEDFTGKLAEAVKEFAESHPLIAIIALLIMITALTISGAFSSCSMVAGGGNDVIITTSFTAEDSDIVAVENDYKAYEAALQAEIDSIESNYSGYDEYRYSIDPIGHDPFELASLLTILYENYTESGVQGTLQSIYDRQYTLIKTEETEIRTKTETKWHYVTYYTTEECVGTRTVDGVEEEYTYFVSVPYEVYESYEEEVEYEYRILNVTLINNGINAAVNTSGLDADQMERYTIILGLKGNKPDVFN